MTFPASTKPHRPAFPPPVPTAPLPDAGGKTPVERAYRTQQQVSDAYTRWRAAHSRDIDPDILKNNAGAFAVSDAALQLPGLLDAVKQDSKDATKTKLDLIENNRVDSDTASQVAAQRYWERSRRSLDAITDAGKVVAAAQDLVANADDGQVPVLSEELPSYLASRRVPAGWLPRVLAVKIPGLADAQADETVKARQLAIVQANHNHLTHAIKADVAAPPLLSPMDVDATPYTDASGD
jgi:hypothetical protein